MKVSLRECFLVMVVFSLAFGWWLDHRRQKSDLLRQHITARDYETRLNAIADGDQLGFSLLIFALSDPNAGIALKANQQLKKLCNQPVGVETFSDECYEANSASRWNLIRDWVDWKSQQLTAD